jgi:hypothetical protein
LTDERVAVLDRLGFVWDSHGCVWDKRFHELQNFHRQFGHSNVPYNHPNAQLASWVKAQRREYKNFKEGKGVSSLMIQRFVQLERLDFCWQLRTSNGRTATGSSKSSQAMKQQQQQQQQQQQPGLNVI